MIDSHTHLDRGPAPEAELVAQAREAGLTRILTIGMDVESRRAALQAAETYPEVFAAIGHHPNEATGYGDPITDELREQARHPRCLAIGETGLDDFRDYAPRADQERAFAAQIALAHEVDKPLIIPKPVQHPLPLPRWGVRHSTPDGEGLRRRSGRRPVHPGP